MTPALMTKHSYARAIESVVVAFGRSPVVAVLCLGLVFSVFTSGAHLLTFPWRQNAALIIGFGIFVLLIFEFSQSLARREAPVAILPFLVGSLAVGLIIRLAYVWQVSPEWYTDFLRYWQTGVNLAASDDVVVKNIYDQRALFLTRPIIEVFGESRSALVVVNVLLLTFIQAVGYDLARRTHSHQAAQAFSILWIAAPEPLLTAAVPNHDLAGLSLTAITLWLLVAAQDSHSARRGVLYAVLAGLTLALLEAVRGLGVLFAVVLAALGLAALIVQFTRHGTGGFGSTSFQRGVLSLLVVIISLFASLNILARMGATIDPAISTTVSVRYTTPHSTSLSPGAYRFYAGFRKAFTDDLENNIERSTAFRKSLVVSDFMENPLLRIQSSVDRMQRQYSFGSQQGFYLRGTSPKVKAAAAVYTDFFRLGFAILLLIAIYKHLNQSVQRVTLTDILLLFIATTSMTLLLFGESQPRYLFSVWFVGALVIPLQARSIDYETARRSPTMLLISAFVALGSLILLTLAIAHVGLRDNNGRILSQWEFSNDVRDTTAGNRVLAELQDQSSNVLVDLKGKPIPTRFGPLSLKLMLPAPPALANAASARTEVCGIQHPASLEFQFAAPWPGKKGTFSLDLAANDTSIWRSSLPNGGRPERVTLALPIDVGNCVELQFTLYSHTDRAGLSWQRASFVEIFFPRVVRDEGQEPTVASPDPADTARQADKS